MFQTASAGLTDVRGPVYSPGVLPAFPAYTVFDGDPYADGVRHGREYARALREAVSQAWQNPCWGAGGRSLRERKRILVEAGRLLAEYPFADAEVRGMAEGADLSYDDLLVTSWPEACVSLGQDPRAPSRACTFVALRDGNRVVVGNNLDNPPVHFFVHCRRPDELEYISTFGVGCVNAAGGVNAAGLILASVSIQPFPHLCDSARLWTERTTGSAAVPGTCDGLLNRRILATARTVQEAVQMYSAAVPLFRGTGILIADAGAHMAIVSRSVGYTHAVTITEDRVAWPNICQDEVYVRDVLKTDLAGYLQRIANDPAMQPGFGLMRKAWLDAQLADPALASTEETLCGLMRNPEGHVLKANTVLTFVADSRRRRVLLAFGSNPQNPFHAVHFGDERDRLPHPQV
jgi:hypothetical protein